LAVDDEQLPNSETPPTQAQCASAGRRCFAPQAIQASYNLLPLYAGGKDGRGRMIAIVDSYGSDTMAHDLHVFDQAFGLAPMCGEEGVACAQGMPKFSELTLQGSPATKAPPSKSNGTGQEGKSAWALEVALDVETSHAIAPGANILLVHTPTAETLGVQGFPQMMAAEKYVVDNHLADVISQSSPPPRTRSAARSRSRACASPSRPRPPTA
jgi:subtilase family serine protease